MEKEMSGENELAHSDEKAVPVGEYDAYEYQDGQSPEDDPANEPVEEKKTWQEHLVSFGKEILSYVLIFVAVLLITKYVVRLDKVKGPSMENTLHNGDYGLMCMISKIERGDIIIFQAPDDNKGVYYIKRVIGVGGDEVIINGNEVHVNGEKLQEDYIKDQNFYGEVHLTVPKGEYFCMGDNRNESSDSRAFGTIKKEDVLGEWLFKIISTN